MTEFGYTLYCEGNDPRSLVEQAVAAEEAGFDFLVISDHYHPWLGEQEHAGFAWTILGAVAQATSTIRLATMVTCPILRYHPALVAQMAATTAVLSNDRFTLGLGAGERLNEHVVGRGWPPADVRHEMLEEAIGIVRELWTGRYVAHRGRHFTVEDARVFDLPSEPIDIYVAAGGPHAARTAAGTGSGVCVTEPEAAIIDAYRDAGGGEDDVWGQVVLAWAASEEQGLQEAYRQFRFSLTGWKVQSELPNPANFDAATAHAKPRDLAETTPAGPDPEAFEQAIQGFIDVGVRRLAVAYPGEDKAGFFEFWSRSLRGRLAAAA